MEAPFPAAAPDEGSTNGSITPGAEAGTVTQLERFGDEGLLDADLPGPGETASSSGAKTFVQYLAQAF
jgi:hypothetical protein